LTDNDELETAITTDSLVPDQTLVVQDDLPPATDNSAEPEAMACTFLYERIAEQLGKVVVGQTEMVRLLTVALLSGGHVLLEGVPGTAKTLTVRALARIFNCSFSRIQFTPDLMPSDILGVNVFDPSTGEFHIKTGPVFAGLVLADEVNRTPPKTQSALLEAMEERAVTIDGVRHPLPEPFMVCATQNPVEYEGTYPLPEAQLDRFMMQIVIPYPSAEDEIQILDRVQAGFRSQDLNTANLEVAADVADLHRYRAETDAVTVAPEVRKYIVDLCRGTRESRHIALGASPRAAITLLNASRSLAAISGRRFVTPDDVATLVIPILRHRLIIKAESELEGHTGASILQSVIKGAAVPR
jgi:MoxR-like ATPase